MQVINLVKTVNGFSVLEGTAEINRVSGRSSREKPVANPKKFVQQNFTIYPYISTKQVENNEKYIIFPVKSQWFNFNSIHEIEKKALPEWFKTRKVIFGSVKPDKFQKNQELYKKYRNYIIDLGRNQYISPTRARKGLAGDACSIIKIHQFLEKWGLINFAFPKRPQKTYISSQPEKRIHLEKRKDCIDKDKPLCSKAFNKDDLELLKKITRKYRPFCHLCDGICGVVWYEYTDKLFLKQYIKNEETDSFFIKNSEEPFEYCFRVCAYCIDNGGIPVVLTIEDFTKVNFYDGLEYFYEEPKEKKKVTEENKLLDTIQKNKFNIKKSAQILKMEENALFRALMFMPMIKLDKMSRIDPETDTEVNNIPGEMIDERHEPIMNGNHQEKTLSMKESFKKQLQNLYGEQMKIYEEFLQSWFLKVYTKMKRLGEWQKSIHWFAKSCLDTEKNKLAETLKNVQMKQ